MSALEIFKYDGADVRTVTIDGEPWFVAADVARILGYRMASDFTRRLDDDEKGTRSMRTLGGEQDLTIISESGLYVAVIGSMVEGAREFKRWITRDVIPSIRRTGSYVAPETPEQLLARAVIQAQQVIERKDEQIAVLTPRAEAWDELASADGDYAVSDAAKILARAGVKTGPQRLFEQLAGMRWIHRASDGKWRAYAATVDSGYLTEKPQSHHHPRSGELVLDAPQVRVTVRGLERLRVRLGVIAA